MRARTRRLGLRSSTRFRIRLPDRAHRQIEARTLIEVAAGLGFIMVATGLYLLWPRGAGQGLRAMLLPRLSAQGRAAWRSWHAVGGFWASAVLSVFLVTGMAWTGVWGERWVQAWSTFPAEKWDAAPLSDATYASLNGAGGKDVPGPRTP